MICGVNPSYAQAVSDFKFVNIAPSDSLEISRADLTQLVELVRDRVEFSVEMKIESANSGRNYSLIEILIFKAEEFDVDSGSNSLQCIRRINEIEKRILDRIFLHLWNTFIEWNVSDKDGKAGILLFGIKSIQDRTRVRRLPAIPETVPFFGIEFEEDSSYCS